MMCLASWPDAARSPERCMRPIRPTANVRLPGRGSRSSQWYGREARKRFPAKRWTSFTERRSGCAGSTERALGEKLPDLMRRSGVAEEITLHLGATDCLQRFHLLLGFHALGGGR